VPTVGIATTEFCYLGGILQLLRHQNQQILRLSTAAARLHLVGSSSTARSNLHVPFKKKLRQDQQRVHSRRFMEQRAETVERNQATTMKEILRDLQDPVQLSRFTSELATFGSSSRYKFRSDLAVWDCSIFFGLIGGT
jgi:hypothetical protein